MLGEYKIADIDRPIKDPEIEIRGNKELINKICDLILSEKATYREANEALYYADRVLREVCLTTKLAI